jgi:hypothetical protein
LFVCLFVAVFVCRCVYLLCFNAGLRL